MKHLYRHQLTANLASNQPYRMSHQYITQSQLLSIHQDLLDKTKNQQIQGFFGPNSMFWTVNRCNTVFLGAGRAALLQLAHPWVSQAVSDHSIVHKAPYKRFINTFIPIFQMVYGNQTLAIQASNRVHHIHSKVQGMLTNSDHYYANNPSAIQWVFATLIDSAILSHEMVWGKLSKAEKNQYYEESKIFAQLFGLKIVDLPQTWNDFMDYNQAMHNSSELQVTETAQRISHSLFKPQSPFLKPIANYYKALTASIMPINLNQAFKLPTANPKKCNKQFKQWGQFFKYLPISIRYAPAYNEALARIQNKPTPFPVRLCNKILLGKQCIANQEVN